jgi:hypothetical protein
VGFGNAESARKSQANVCDHGDYAEGVLVYLLA